MTHPKLSSWTILALKWVADGWHEGPDGKRVDLQRPVLEPQQVVRAASAEHALVKAKRLGYFAPIIEPTKQQENLQ